MNHVHTEQQGDAQAAVLYGKFLHFADVLHAFQVEQTSDFTVADFTGNVAALGLSGDDVSRYRQVELTDFSCSVILPISSVMNLSISCGLPWDVFSLGVAVTVRAEKAKAANNVYFFI